MSTVLLWLAGWVVAAVLLAALLTRLRFLYRRRQLRRHYDERRRQVEADLEIARARRYGSLTDDERAAFNDIATRNQPWIPSQRTEEPS